MRIDLLGTPVDILSSQQTIDLVQTAMQTRNRLQHVALNVAKLVTLQRNEDLREDVAASDIVGIDGMGVVLALKLMGHSHASRVSGVDLMLAVLALCAREGYRPYFLGATPTVVREAASVAERRFEGLSFAGFQDGYFSQDEEAAVMQRVQDARPDCLFIGMPTPRKERLLRAWRDRLDIPFIMGVGGGLDVVAGKVARAPLWMQSNGLEWLYRIYQEPGRMWWRYLSTNTSFAVMLLQIMAQRYLLQRRI